MNYLHNFRISCGLMWISDTIAQAFESNFTKFDVKRNVKMTLLGGITNGLFLTKWYIIIDYHFKRKILYKIIADQLVYSPLSIGFFLVSTNEKDCSLNGYRTRVDNNFLDIWKTDCFVWPISNYLNFKYIPLRSQTIFTSYVDLGWNSYISYSLYKPTIN